MKWRVEWADPALRELSKLDRQVARQITEAVGRLAETGQGDVIHLGSPLSGYRLRVRDWRVFMDRDGDTLTVTAIRHRREAYRPE